ncbi:MAG TPA: helix-turn-helix domain-containing protein [Candidatus Gallimonas intestinavium]|uniref:Helix-turn-helix domain-containing protein n=1 Tax=Candidatus Gallimonas intestinavium TaxID=2838603 RepID=A0A9D2JYQ9_9FIRM|nr:helix-turn-helix domain-containing protein [Candidatus Gallimonas intestinavium]
MFDTVKVGRIISQKRKEHNMTQMQLADALGISFQAVSNWERGNSMPDISKLPELAELFGCSIEELLGGGRSAGNVEKMTKGEDLSLGELADIAPVLPPDVLDKAAASALSEDGDDDEAETDEEPEDFDEPDDEDAEDEDEDNDEDDDDDAPMRARWWRGREGADAYIARGGKKPRFFIFKSGKTGDKKGDKRRSKRIRELVCLAPFLSEERLAELVKDLQDDGFTVSELVPLAPFLSEEDLDALAQAAAADGGELAALAPFLSQETLKRLAERGGVKSGQLVALAPFLSREVLEELVLKALERGERIPRGLYPFLSERAIVEILKHKK